MSNTPHDLHAEFPNDTAVLHEMKLHDAHFQSVSDRYYELNDAIHRAEAEVEPTSDFHLEDLKKQRLQLLDDVAGMIARAKATAA